MDKNRSGVVPTYFLSTDGVIPITVSEVSTSDYQISTNHSFGWALIIVIKERLEILGSSVGDFF